MPANAPQSRRAEPQPESPREREHRQEVHAARQAEEPEPQAELNLL